MAHADYNCCAVCDCKLEYIGCSAKSKERICEDCLKNLRDRGVNVITVEELIEWIKKEKENAIKILDEIGYNRCYYFNDVDDTIEEVRKQRNG